VEEDEEMRGKEKEESSKADNSRNNQENTLGSPIIKVIRISSLDYISASLELGECIMQGHMMGITT